MADPAAKTKAAGRRPFLRRTAAGREQLAAAQADLRDRATGWTRLAGPGRSNDRPDAEQQYRDALEAWRKNPYAKRVIDIITDYVVGDGLTPTAPGEIGRFVEAFWRHPQNRLDLRLPDLVDELSRAGDLFLALFRNPHDGMSYVRAVPKSEVLEIRTADNDWEREIAYVVRGEPVAPVEAGERQDRRPALQSVFLAPEQPGAAEAEAVMLHYSINRPVGALLGESELATVIPWLLRYSRMLEDRVRLNWAARTFLWFVKVPSMRVDQKAAQYGDIPEPGSIVVHDDGERWDTLSPDLHGMDAQHDLRALRQIISAGAGQPPHWHGDGGDVNRAVAAAMQDPALRRLRRRQRHLQYLAADLCHTAYARAYEIGAARRRPERGLIEVAVPDISREDNESLALAAERLAAAFAQTAGQLPGYSPSLAERMVSLVFRFAGEPLPAGEAARLVAEAGR